MFELNKLLTIITLLCFSVALNVGMNVSKNQSQELGITKGEHHERAEFTS